MLPLRYRRLWVAISAVLLAAVIFASLQPNFGPPMPHNFDKLEHLSAYLVLSVWFTGLVARERYWVVVCGLLALGLSIEVLQGVMNVGRSAEALDMLANTVGVVVGLTIALGLTGHWALRVESWLARR
jgi:VanZ family protein